VSWRWTLRSSVLILAAALATVSSAAPPDGPELRSSVLAGGGASAGGDYVVHGTVAQPDDDPLHPATGGPWSVVGGFWVTVSDQPQGLFSDSFED